MLERRQDHRRLGRVVAEEGRLADLGGRGDLGNGRRVVPLGDEQLDRGLADASRVRAFFVSRRFAVATDPSVPRLGTI